MLADDFWELWSQAMKTLLQGLARNDKLKENKSLVDADKWNQKMSLLNWNIFCYVEVFF